MRNLNECIKHAEWQVKQFDRISFETSKELLAHIKELKSAHKSLQYASRVLVTVVESMQHIGGDNDDIVIPTYFGPFHSHFVQQRPLGAVIAWPDLTKGIDNIKEIIDA